MNKNRNMKYILIISVFVGTLIIGINFDNIKFSLSMFDIYRNAKIEEKSNSPIKKEPVENPLLKIIENEKTVDNMVGNSNTALDTPEKVVRLEEVEEIEEDSQKIMSETSTADNVSNLVETRSIHTITKDYNDKLTNLQREFENELNILIKSAINDYNAGVSNTKLANMYIEKGSELEKYSDAKFYSLLGEMEVELKENSHNTIIIDEVKLYYETFKSDKKALLMSEGIELVLK